MPKHYQAIKQVGVLTCQRALCWTQSLHNTVIFLLLKVFSILEESEQQELCAVKEEIHQMKVEPLWNFLYLCLIHKLILGTVFDKLFIFQNQIDQARLMSFQNRQNMRKVRYIFVL